MKKPKKQPETQNNYIIQIQNIDDLRLKTHLSHVTRLLYMANMQFFLNLKKHFIDIPFVKFARHISTV